MSLMGFWSEFAAVVESFFGCGEPMDLLQIAGKSSDDDD